MGHNKRRELNEMIATTNRYPNAFNLGHLCASGFVMLNVACQRCPRRGRYRITRLIDQHGPLMGLPDLKAAIAADCPRQRAASIYDRCGAYFPDKYPEPPTRS